MELAKHVYGVRDPQCRVCGRCDGTIYGRVDLPSSHAYLCEDCLSIAIELNVVQQDDKEDFICSLEPMELAAIILQQKKEERSSDYNKDN